MNSLVAKGDDFGKLVRNTLPRRRPAHNLYELTMSERRFVRYSKNIAQLMSDPTIEGVYETKVSLLAVWAMSRLAVLPYPVTLLLTLSLSLSRSLSLSIFYIVLFLYLPHWSYTFGVVAAMHTVPCVVMHVLVFSPFPATALVCVCVSCR